MEEQAGAQPVAPTRLPPGELLIAGSPFDSRLFERVDRVLREGRCAHGRLELETGSVRLICLIHEAKPLLAGLVEGDRWSRVSLRELPARARELEGASSSLIATDATLTRMSAVQFGASPVLRSSTRLVDAAHVLQVLADERQDAVLAFERQAARTLVFLPAGRPTRIYFGDRREEPGSGDVADRLLTYAFAPSVPPGRVEVFTDLEVPGDADQGAPLAELAEVVKTPPSTSVVVTLAGGREVLHRPFTPPHVVIGRDPGCEIFLDNLAVSRHHARIAWSRGRFVLEDLDSANGTRVHGTRIQSVPLGTGDRIEVGKFRISLVDHGEAVSLSETMLLGPAQIPIRLVLEGEGQEVPLEEGAVIGRGEGVEVRARGWGVRPVHARLRRKGAGVEVSCFGQAQVKVNGRRTRSGTLVAGDRLVIGRSQFLVARR